MPSRDPATGRPITGAQGRARRAAAAALVPAAASPLSAFADTPPPPVADGVPAVEAWAAALLMQAAATAPRTPPERVQLDALTAVCRELGRLRAKAARSHKALTLAQLRLGWPPVDLTSPTPPTDRPVAACAWAFVNLALLAHLVVTKPIVISAPGFAQRVRALVAIGFLPANDEIARVIREAKAA